MQWAVSTMAADSGSAMRSEQISEDETQAGKQKNRFWVRTLVFIAVIAGITLIFYETGLIHFFLNKKKLLAFLDSLGPAAFIGFIFLQVCHNHETVRSIIDLEEKRFGEALNSGLNVLDRVMEAAGADKRIRGEDAFMLYDTYGFPKELTIEVASERGFTIDVDGFEREMERQRERARASHKFGGGDKTDLKAYEQLGVTASAFVGYETCCRESVVMGLIADGEPVDSVSEGDEVDVVLKESPFYGEMGGQVGDTGEIRGAQGKISVRQTVRPLADLIVHQGRVVKGHDLCTAAGSRHIHFHIQACFLVRV